MKDKEYTIEEIQTFLEYLSGMYDLARIVDPTECRIIEFKDNKKITANESCYGIWNSRQRCANCSSVIACQTGCHQIKDEYFKNKIYHIQSNPVKIKLPDGGVYSAVLELVNIEDNSNHKYDNVNDREAENIGNSALRHHEMYDSLTGVLKYEEFYEQARNALESRPNTTWTLITSDIMEFRLFNSLFGIEKGNEALVKIAMLLQAIAKKCSGICSRLYRDKFAVFIPSENYNEEDFLNLAKSIRSELSNGIYTLCIHFGVYQVYDTNIPISVMCDRANIALKTIHKDVKNVIEYFDGKILERSILEQEIISGFYEALKNESFKMYLQPLARKDGVPFGAEALVRWIQPDGSVIPPGIFISTLENAGLIHELDKRIWELAVKQLSIWKNTDKKDLTISVNMSAKDFYNIDIYKVLTDLTSKYGVDNNKLRIEITESALIEEPDRSHPVIARLQDAGFLIEIDDFGKGQSSLGMLKDIKADILKIDIEFLRETENIMRSRIILKSVIEMANALGMQVIAEGVEPEHQIQSLTEMGCDSFQGYYFSRPIPVDQFEAKYTYS